MTFAVRRSRLCFTLYFSQSAALVVLFSSALWLTDAKAADEFEQQVNVVYAEVHGTGLLMDVFTPTGPRNGLAIVDVVSGAWFSDRRKIHDHMSAQLYSIFCQRGYVVFAARPGSRTRYSVSEMDRHVKWAIQYAKEHAAEYQIDPQRLGLTGASAGGHLATLAALTPVTARPEAQLTLEHHDSSVAAVAVFFPPTDFVEWRPGQMTEPKLLQSLLYSQHTDRDPTPSEEEIREAARAISPVFRVNQPSNPFLLIHGDADEVVPLSHSEKLVAAIQKAGGSAELIVKKGGGHPWPTLPEEVKVMADWFDRQLGRAP